MACLIALIIFGIMGIFSASHRALAKEAFICVFKRVTFRPCDTGFKEKIKLRFYHEQITGNDCFTVLKNKYEFINKKRI